MVFYILFETLNITVDGMTIFGRRNFPSKLQLGLASSNSTLEQAQFDFSMSSIELFRK